MKRKLIKKYLDDRSHLQVSFLQLSFGPKLPLFTDVASSVSCFSAGHGPDPGTDAPVDVLGGHALVVAGGVIVRVPGSGIDKLLACYGFCPVHPPPTTHHHHPH